MTEIQCCIDAWESKDDDKIRRRCPSFLVLIKCLKFFQCTLSIDGTYWKMKDLQADYCICFWLIQVFNYLKSGTHWVEICTKYNWHRGNFSTSLATGRYSASKSSYLQAKNSASFSPTGTTWIKTINPILWNLFKQRENRNMHLNSTLLWETNSWIWPLHHPVLVRVSI